VPHSLPTAAILAAETPKRPNLFQGFVKQVCALVHPAMIHNSVSPTFTRAAEKKGSFSWTKKFLRGANERLPGKRPEVFLSVAFQAEVRFDSPAAHQSGRKAWICPHPRTTCRDIPRQRKNVFERSRMHQHPLIVRRAGRGQTAGSRTSSSSSRSFRSRIGRFCSKINLEWIAIRSAGIFREAFGCRN